MASLSGNNKIVLRGGYTEGGAEHEEGILLAAASPGMNVVLAANFATQERHSYTPGSTDYVGTGTGSTTSKNPMTLVKEKTTEGLTVDDAYTAGDNVLLHHCKPGDVVQVLVLSGETVAKATGVSANTAGKFVADVTNAAAIALEDSAGALAADTLMRVRVL